MGDGVWKALLPLVSPVIGAAASIGGSLIGAHSQRKANQQQVDLSNTAVQRRVADLKAAGLNPAMAYDNQASTPMISSEVKPDIGDRAVSNASSARRLSVELDSMRAAAESSRASAVASKSQASKSDAERESVQIDNEIKRFDLGLRQSVVGDEPSWRDEMMARRRAVLRDLAFQGTLQPHTLREAQAAAALRTYQASLAGRDFEDAPLATALKRAQIFSTYASGRRSLSGVELDRAELEKRRNLLPWSELQGLAVSSPRDWLKYIRSNAASPDKLLDWLWPRAEGVVPPRNPNMTRNIRELQNEADRLSREFDRMLHGLSSTAAVRRLR